MRVKARISESGRVKGQDYSVPYQTGIRLIRAFRVLWVGREPGDGPWEPVEQLKAPRQTAVEAEHNRMVKGGVNR